MSVRKLAFWQLETTQLRSNTFTEEFLNRDIQEIHTVTCGTS